MDDLIKENSRLREQIAALEGMLKDAKILEEEMRNRLLRYMNEIEELQKVILNFSPEVPKRVILQYLLDNVTVSCHKREV